VAGRLSELEFMIDKVRSMYLKHSWPYRLADEAERVLVGKPDTPDAEKSQPTEK